MTSQTKTWNVGDVYYQAQMFRHGRGLDYDCPPRVTWDEAHEDLRGALAMMSEREVDQSTAESYVGKFSVDALDDNGDISAAHSVT